MSFLLLRLLQTELENRLNYAVAAAAASVVRLDTDMNDGLDYMLLLLVLLWTGWVATRRICPPLLLQPSG